VTHPHYCVTWDGEEYVARSGNFPDMSGHSRLALYALQALVRKAREEGLIDQDGALTAHNPPDDSGERKA